LVVAADLLKRGYHVFRAMSPACPCDLVLLENGHLLRVEVTTGFLSGNGTLHHPKKASGKYDVLAVVCGSAVTYTPELPIFKPKKGTTEVKQASLAHVPLTHDDEAQEPFP
jgi:hypothetical protein